MVLDSQVTFVLSVLLYGIMLTTLVTAIGTYAVYKIQDIKRKRSNESLPAGKPIVFEPSTAHDGALTAGRRRRVRFGS